MNLTYYRSVHVASGALSTNSDEIVSAWITSHRESADCRRTSRVGATCLHYRAQRERELQRCHVVLCRPLLTREPEVGTLRVAHVTRQAIERLKASATAFFREAELDEAQVARARALPPQRATGR